MDTSNKPTPRWLSILKKVVIILVAIVGILLLAVLLLGLKPIHVEEPIASAPLESYDEALAAVQAVQDKELATPDFNPVCESILMDHGGSTEEVIVLFHRIYKLP
ncbi:MAG: hypothetical protein R3C44_02555 [Chloroflexota bacterium]